jgi:hypothetical protein
MFVGKKGCDFVYFADWLEVHFQVLLEIDKSKLCCYALKTVFYGYPETLLNSACSGVICAPLNGHTRKSLRPYAGSPYRTNCEPSVSLAKFSRRSTRVINDNHVADLQLVRKDQLSARQES